MRLRSFARICGKIELDRRKISASGSLLHRIQTSNATGPLHRIRLELFLIAGSYTSLNPVAVSDSLYSLRNSADERTKTQVHLALVIRSNSLLFGQNVTRTADLHWAADSKTSLHQASKCKERSVNRSFANRRTVNPLLLYLLVAVAE